jgi:hypothetical protein
MFVFGSYAIAKLGSLGKSDTGRSGVALHACVREGVRNPAMPTRSLDRSFAASIREASP